MTHIAAFHFEDEIQVFADTVSSKDGKPEKRETTSFGQENLPDDEIVAREGCLKIAIRGETAIAYAGRRGSWRMFHTEFERLCRVAPSEIIAIETALGRLSHDSAASLDLVVASRANGCLQIYVYRSDKDIGSRRLTLISSPVWQTGSLPKEYQAIVQAGAQGVSVGNRAHRMAYLLAMLQTTTVHDSVLKHGVGGAYTAVTVRKDGIFWQPRIGYLITSSGVAPEMVLCMVRAGMLFVSSRMGTPRRETPFFNIIWDKEPSRKWQLSQSMQVDSIFRRLNVDYLTIIRNDRRNFVVVETRRKRESKDFRIGSTKDHSGGYRFRHDFSKAVEKCIYLPEILDKEKETLGLTPITYWGCGSVIGFRPGRFDRDYVGDLYFNHNRQAVEIDDD